MSVNMVDKTSKAYTSPPPKKKPKTTQPNKQPLEFEFAPNLCLCLISNYTSKKKYLHQIHRGEETESQWGRS